MDFNNFKEQHDFLDVTKVNCSAVDRIRLETKPRVAVETPVSNHKNFQGCLIERGKTVCKVALPFWMSAYLLVTVESYRVIDNYGGFAGDSQLPM